MKILLSCLLLLCSLCGHANKPLAINVDSSKPKFVVTLPSNPTTGYQWVVTKYDQKRLTLVKSKYIAPQTKLIGAGGNMTFTFKRNKGVSYPKATQMKFAYKRSWDPKSETLKTVTINFSH